MSTNWFSLGFMIMALFCMFIPKSIFGPRICFVVYLDEGNYSYNLASANAPGIGSTVSLGPAAHAARLTVDRVRWYSDMSAAIIVCSAPDITGEKLVEAGFKKS